MIKIRFLENAVLLSALSLAFQSAAHANSGPEAQTKVDNKTARLVSLADSIDPLKEHFNANRGKNRFITLLSPT